MCRSLRVACALDLLEKEQPCPREPSSAQWHPAWEFQPIQDYRWKHHISVAVSSPAGLSTEGAILNKNLLWKLFKMFSFKGSNLCHLLGFFPLELCLSFLHLIGMDPARTRIGARFMSIHCGFSCSSPCLEKALCPSWATDLSNCIICPIKVSPFPMNFVFFQPVDRCQLCWPVLFGGISWPRPLPALASILGL